MKHQPRSTHGLVSQAMLHIAAGSLTKSSGLLLDAAQQHALSSSAMTWYCWNNYLAGEFANAPQHIEQYQASGRHGPIVAAIEALAYIQLKESDAQIERIEALAADSRHHDVVRGALGFAYGMAGQSQKAKEILNTMTRPETQINHERYAIALVLIGLNQTQEATQRLEQSYREGWLWSLGFRSDPILASLCNDPHYRLFMSKVSYPAS